MSPFLSAVDLWVPTIRSWALTRGFALHPGTRNRYEIRYTRTQHRPASRQVTDHGRVSGTHRGFGLSLGVSGCYDTAVVTVTAVSAGVAGSHPAPLHLNRNVVAFPIPKPSSTQISTAATSSAGK